MSAFTADLSCRSRLVECQASLCPSSPSPSQPS